MKKNILQDRASDYSTKPLPEVPLDFKSKESQDAIIIDNNDDQVCISSA